MNRLQASSLVPGASRAAYWTIITGERTSADIGIIHLLFRDLPGDTKQQHKVDEDDEDDDDDDIEVAHRTATRSRSTRSIASGFVKAMYI